MSAIKHLYQFCLVTAIAIGSVNVTLPTYGQVASDASVSTSVGTSNNRDFIITGGTKAENNLFHSFQDFSIPGGGSAIFEGTQGVDNIISRVTGSSVSNIQGLIQTQGNANFFLINPNGIIFGPNAQLSIQGSFLATTASQINFTNGPSFSATETQTKPLLSVSTPIGLQFGANVKPIVNQSQASDSIGPAGLHVETGRTLALVGGDITLKNGMIYAPEGRIELGSVDENSFVSLTPVGDSVSMGWRLGYENVHKFRDILLSGSPAGTSLPFSTVSADTVKTPGEIYFRGRNITINNQSQVLNINYGAIPGGIIAIQASESVAVSDRSQLRTNTDLFDPKLTGSAGNIKVETQRLLVSDGSFIDASTFTAGKGGDIIINSPASVEIRGNGLITQITTQTTSKGDAGELMVTTGKLTLSDGGQIASSTIGVGDGGKVTVQAPEFILISGQGKSPDGTIALSGLFARTRRYATGNGGLLRIDTGRLTVEKGASVSVAATDSSTGQAGRLNINASNSVEVSGVGSSLRASSDSPKPAGDLTINTNNLVVQNDAEISVGSTNTGNAGNLRISSANISLTNRGKLTSTNNRGTGGGNIFLQPLNSLVLRGDSEISTNAQGQGNGGNIEIDTDLLTALENSSITANATGIGNGGKVLITTQGLFVSRDSEITATSEQGINGVVEINRLENEPNDDLNSVSVEPVDLTELIATGCGASGSVASRTSISKFIITGRGGLPPTPTEALRSDRTLADLGDSVKDIAASTTTATKQVNVAPTPIVEAQGWVISPQGQVVLTASAPNVTPEVPWLKSPSCHNS